MIAEVEVVAEPVENGSGVRTYRGRTLEDILPQIREQLGPDAIILREREGLVGGIGGFFAQRFVEVEARAGGPSIDIYDSEDEESAEPDEFQAKLREAAAAWTEDDAPVAELPAPAPAAEPEPAPEPEQPKPARKPRAATAKKAPAKKAAPKPKPAPAKRAAKPRASKPAAKEATKRTPKRAPAKAAAPQPAPEPIRPPALPAPPELPAPPAVLAPVAAPRGLRALLARWFGPKPTAAVPEPVPAPARTIDATAASGILGDLTARGAGRLWSSQLVSAAGAHGLPLHGGGSLRESARRELARRIVPAPALPSGGAAIAFVGAGGSGKSRCAAALALAYRRTSTLTVSVLALGTADAGTELRGLLAEDGVPVYTDASEAAARRVAEGRGAGLVIVDTPPATPTDPAQIQALAAALAPLSLDAVYVTLPATLGAQAARRALASFGAVQPTAVAITHADETDQIGVAVEIATVHRIPLVLVNGGSDVRSSLSPADPLALARELLP